MFHLYRNVYLETDENLDPNKDRCVYSKIAGFPMWSELAHEKAFSGKLHDCGTSIDSESFLNALQNYTNEKKFVIYGDDDSLAKMFATWINFILPNSNEDTAFLIYKSLIFQKNVTNQANDWYTGSGAISLEILENEFRDYYNKFKMSNNEQEGKYAFVKQQHDIHPSIEYVLATFISTGKMHKQLSDMIQMIMRKVSEEYLVGLKIEFMTEFNKIKFSQCAKLKKIYTLDNLEDIYEDDSPIGNFFMSSRIFGSKYVLKPSAYGHNLIFENITNKDIEILEQYIENIKQPREYFDMLKRHIKNIQSGFTKDELYEFLTNEAYVGKNESDSIFSNAIFSNTSDTINKYLINHILNRVDEPEKIREFSLI